MAHRPDTAGSSYGRCVVGVQAAEEPSAKSQLPTRVREFVAALFPANPLEKECIGTASA